MTARKQKASDWPTYAQQIGLNLLKARKATGLSQERVAHAAGITANTYQKFEKGESRPGAPMNPRLITLVALTQALGVELSDVLPPEPPDMTSGR